MLGLERLTCLHSDWYCLISTAASRISVHNAKRGLAGPTLLLLPVFAVVSAVQTGC
jgi:hypothetical protein